MSTKVEKIILDNADHWWPGSADRLVAIYQACSRDKQRSFRAAVSINIMLTAFTSRGEILASFRDIIPVGTRGAAKERYDAAIIALDSLIEEQNAARSAALEGDETTAQPGSMAVVHGPVTVTVNERGTEVAAWATSYFGPAVQKAVTVQSIAEEVYGLGLPATPVDPVNWPGFEPQPFAICPAMLANQAQVWNYKGITVPVWVESTMTITASDKAGNVIATAIITPAPDDPESVLDAVRAGVRAEMEKP